MRSPGLLRTQRRGPPSAEIQIQPFFGPGVVYFGLKTDFASWRLGSTLASSEVAEVDHLQHRHWHCRLSALGVWSGFGWWVEGGV